MIFRKERPTRFDCMHSHRFVMSRLNNSGHRPITNINLVYFSTFSNLKTANVIAQYGLSIRFFIVSTIFLNNCELITGTDIDFHQLYTYMHLNLFVQSEKYSIRIGTTWWCRLSDLPLLPGLTLNGDQRPGRSHREAAARSSSRC